MSSLGRKMAMIITYMVNSESPTFLIHASDRAGATITELEAATVDSDEDEDNLDTNNAEPLTPKPNPPRSKHPKPLRVDSDDEEITAVPEKMSKKRTTNSHDEPTADTERKPKKKAKSNRAVTSDDEDAVAEPQPRGKKTNRKTADSDDEGIAADPEPQRKAMSNQTSVGLQWIHPMLRLRSLFWGFLRPTGPFLRALGCSHPVPILWLAQGAYGVAWYCTHAARFGAFYTPRGPFCGPWAAPIQPLSSGLPRGHMVLPGTALAQPVLGLFTPMQGPFCMGGPPFPALLGACSFVWGFSFIPPKPIFRLGPCPSHVLLLAIHQIFSR
ncbi:hypothetical protein DFH08DRAFT_823189 [Mycena albidolilacea]|uniref:Uncharacterized protein n=1 Tax=Mycena albidolilacea TaxID=1033008 RepID=A0AAD6Z7N7_9AGAR|nr:hypothetical protein DFH08DRAFT_823189 [Mycena albidolilacea]